MIFLTILGVTEILCSFRLVLEGKTVKEIPESSRLEFLEMFSANNFLYQMQKTTPPEDYWQFVQKIYSVGRNEKNDFSELWQQCKKLKTM